VRNRFQAFTFHKRNLYRYVLATPSQRVLSRAVYPDEYEAGLYRLNPKP
jgi:hypothetical protein